MPRTLPRSSSRIRTAPTESYRTLLDYGVPLDKHLFDASKWVGPHARFSLTQSRRATTSGPSLSSMCCARATRLNLDDPSRLSSYAPAVLALEEGVRLHGGDRGDLPSCQPIMRTSCCARLVASLLREALSDVLETRLVPGKRLTALHARRDPAPCMRLIESLREGSNEDGSLRGCPMRSDSSCSQSTT
jgi:hypothetical protein